MPLPEHTGSSSFQRGDRLLLDLNLKISAKSSPQGRNICRNLGSVCGTRL